jgi:hypothetical protein
MRKVKVLLVIPLLCGCLAGGFWGTVSGVRDAVTDELVETCSATSSDRKRCVSDAVTNESAETQAPGEHNCACDLKGKSRAPFYWCDADGTRNDEGTHACCLTCKKDCGEVIPPGGAKP